MRLAALTSEVSTFESEAVAKASLSLTVRAAMSAQGARALVANYAATSGRVPNAPAEAPVGARGRRYSACSAPSHYARSRARGGLRPPRLVPLLQAIERRLGTFR